MGFVVLPAAIPDIKKCYDVYFAAFDGTAISQILFPWDTKSPEFRAGHTKHTLDYWHNTTTQYTCKCVDTETDQIVGMGLWDVHWKDRATEATKPAVDWLQGAQKARAEGLIHPLWERKEQLLGPSKHVYCHIIAVDPNFERKGIGAMLTRWGLHVAEQLQVPVYLESTEKAVKLYEKLGFELLIPGVPLKAEVMGSETDLEAPIMAWMPSSAEGKSFAKWVEQGRPSLDSK